MSFVWFKRLVTGTQSYIAVPKQWDVMEPVETDPEKAIIINVARYSNSIGTADSLDGDSQTTEEPLLSKHESTDGLPPQTTSRFSSRLISDATIGLSDGLTVPFALSAGLSALGSTKVVIYGGMAELIAGAISMGLGGYLGAKGEAEAYKVTLSRIRTTISSSPGYITSMIESVFEPYNLPPAVLRDISTHLAESPPSQLEDFLMRFHHSLPPQSSSHPYISSVTIAAGYFFGGLLPLFPYFLVAKDEVSKAFWWSVLVMACALFVFGYVKTCIVRGWTGRKNVFEGVKGALQMVVVGGLAAGCAMGLVRAFDGL